MEESAHLPCESKKKKRKMEETAHVPCESKKRKLYTSEELIELLEDSDFEFLDNSEDEEWDNNESEDEPEDEAVQENDIDRNNDDGVHDDDDGDNEYLETPSGSEKQIDWKIDPAGMKFFPFTENESLLILPEDNQPINYFRLLLTNEFLLEIVEQTNYNATQIFLSEETTEQSRICQWKDVYVDELLVFLGVFLHMGNVKMRKIQDYWKKDVMFHNEGIARSISRNRFLLILRALHFSRNPDPGEPKPEDRLYKIRPVINYFNSRMTEVYYPGRDLSLDESMVLWRGRLTFRQYIKNKRHKYGIKLYMLTTPKGLVQKFAVYTGMLDEIGGKGHAQKVVLHLLQGKLNVGHHLYMDNYYNSFDLAKTLMEKETHCTGTLRMDRKHCPQDVKSAKLGKGETVARYAEGVMIGKWKDKRDVCYISTEFENKMFEIENKRKEKKQKPLPIVNYNKFMSGVDRQDQMLSYYLSERKTIRWYKKLFIHSIEMLITNAHYLFSKYSGRSMPLFDFRLNIIKKLLPPMNERHHGRQPEADEHLLVKREPTPGKKQIMRKRCRLCAEEGRRTDTIYECPSCPNRPGYCLGCSVITHQ